MDNVKYLSVLKRSDELRSRLYSLIRKNPPDSLKDLAIEMRINFITLRNFLNHDDVKTSFITLVKVEKWCDEHEQI